MTALRITSLALTAALTACGGGGSSSGSGGSAAPATQTGVFTDSAVAGIRYQDENLKSNLLIAGDPLIRYNAEAWLTAPVCDDTEGDDPADTEATEGGT